MSTPLKVQFVGGDFGAWSVESVTSYRGAALETPRKLAMLEGVAAPISAQSIWTLQGVTSYQRYTIRSEAQRLTAIQPPLGRSEATVGVLIPIRKSAAWWSLAQDERREIYEGRSRHTSIGMEYLPRIARRLHHSRDLGEPFDFLTWFEFAPQHAGAFDELLGRLRESEEWQFVEREVELRSVRHAEGPTD